MDRKLVQKPLNNKEDILLAKVVADYFNTLTKEEYFEISALPTAIHFLWALELYRTGGDIYRLAEHLNISSEVVNMYEEQGRDK